MKHPLEYLKYQKSFDLLCDFYSANSKINGCEDLGVFLRQQISEDRNESDGNLSPSGEGSFENRDRVRLSTEAIEKLRQSLLQFFSKAKKHDFRTKEIDPWNLFDFSDVKVFLDYGTNNLRHINSIGRKFPNIERLIAADVIAQSEEFQDKSKGKYLQVDPQNPKLDIDNGSVDAIATKFVLHHFASEDAIKTALSEFTRVLKTGGRYLLWEETFKTENLNLKSLVDFNIDLGILIDADFTKKFYGLSQEERFAFIIINDWVINVKYVHMQWNYQYKSMEAWVSLVESFGFRLVKDYNFGLRLNGLLKQGVHVVMEFEKI